MASSGLLEGPFTVQEALGAGLTKDHLRSRRWRRVARGIYVPANFPDQPRTMLPALVRLLPAGAHFAGRTAAAFFGADLPYRHPIELVVPGASCASKSAHFNLSRALLQPSELTDVDGVPLTTPVRTLLDVSRRLSLTESVVLLDHFLHSGTVTEAQLSEQLESVRGRCGRLSFGRALELADGRAESPMETRLRIQLIFDGLPCPEVQAVLRDHAGGWVAKVDLYYPQALLGIEYDGAYHRDNLDADLSRQNRIVQAGYRLLRFSAVDMRGDRSLISAQVRAELRKAA